MPRGSDMSIQGKCIRVTFSPTMMSGLKKMPNKWKDNAPNQGKHPQNLYGFC